MIKYIIIAGGIIAAGVLYAYAQSSGARVVTTCGTLPQVYSVGSTRQVTVDTTGRVCI